MVQATRNLDDGGSLGGYLIFLSDDTGKRAFLSWQSKRVRRVVKSTHTAESLALLDATQAGVYLRHMVTEMLGIKPIIRCYVDNISLVKAVHSTKAVDDKQLCIDMAALNEFLYRDERVRLRILGAVCKTAS